MLFGDALRTMTAQIDLNPVCAGLAKDPKDYRRCDLSAMGWRLGVGVFVEGLFFERREYCGAKRKGGARKIGKTSVGLFSLRALKLRAVE